MMIVGYKIFKKGKVGWKREEWDYECEKCDL